MNQQKKRPKRSRDLTRDAIVGFGISFLICGIVVFGVSKGIWGYYICGVGFIGAFLILMWEAFRGK